MEVGRGPRVAREALAGLQVGVEHLRSIPPIENRPPDYLPPGEQD